MLKEIVKRQPKIIFKGGTSLSKCYHIINRFSEDIDLNIDYELKPTQGERKNLYESIKNIIIDYGFSLKNDDEVFSRRDFNRYEISVNSLFTSEYIKHDLIIETSLFIRSYPNIKMKVDSYVYEYLKSINREDIIDEYELEPFEIDVQTIERTFIDKIFALCDYHLDSKIKEHSRHLYDIFKISNIVKIDDDLKHLFNNVRKERKAHKTCLSAQDNINVKECLQEIIDKDIYRNDFESITELLIYENVSYDEVKANLRKIIDSGLFS